MNPYASHMPILEKLFECCSIRSVIETGMGDFSTRFFCEKGCNLVSIEMQNKPWYEKIEAELKGPNRVFLYLPGKDGACEFLRAATKVDLVLVDGHHHSRFRQIQEAFDKARYIVVHDTEAFVYRWDRVKLPKWWVWIDFEEFSPNPWTALLCKVVDGLNHAEWIEHWRHTKYVEMSKKKYVHTFTEEGI